MVNVLISTDTRYPVNRKIIRKAVFDVFKKHKLESIDSEVSVAVVGARKMEDVSSKFLKDNGNHDILTFALEEVSEDSAFVNPPEEILRLGDVVLCWPKILESASREEKMVDDEVYFLICHGVEHLLGEHHQ